MCLKHHRYYVCNCKNVGCPAVYAMCCPYGPSPSSLVELGHILSRCKSTETTCQNLKKQSPYYPEPCRDAKSELHRVDVGLCWSCQLTCQNKQTGIKSSIEFAALLSLREKEEKTRAAQMKVWSQSVNSDDEA